MAWGNGRDPRDGLEDANIQTLFTGQPRRFTLVPFDQIQGQRMGRYLVKGLIPAESMIVVWGPPKCGKSFWTFDVAMHIAAAQPDYRGLKVRPGAVIYIAAEGGNGFLGRVQAWRERHLAEDASGIPFFLLPMRLDLYVDHKELIADIVAQIPPGLSTSLVVVDTLNRTFTGSESNDDDMTKYIKAADAVKAHFHCAVAIVHHCGHETTRPRGHTSLTGATDCQIKIIRDKETGIVTAEVEWMKDGPEGYKNTSTLGVVNIGKDEDGDEVTTCVIEPSDDSGRHVAKGKKLSPNEQIAHKSLCAAVDEIGRIPGGNSHIHAQTKAVSLENWKNYFDRMFVGLKPDAKPNAARMGFDRSANSLIAKDRVGKWDDNFWIKGSRE